MSASCFGAVFTPNRLSRAATRLIPQLPKRSSLKETLSHYSVQIYRSCTQDASVSPTVPTTLHPTWEDIKSACCGHWPCCSVHHSKEKACHFHHQTGVKLNVLMPTDTCMHTNTHVCIQIYIVVYKHLHTYVHTYYTYIHMYYIHTYVLHIYDFMRTYHTHICTLHTLQYMLHNYANLSPIVFILNKHFHIRQFCVGA